MGVRERASKSGVVYTTADVYVQGARPGIVEVGLKTGCDRSLVAVDRNVKLVVEYGKFSKDGTTRHWFEFVSATAAGK
jgi:hypothetical protein